MTKKTAEIDLDAAFEGLDEATADARRPKLKTGMYRKLRIDSTQFKDGFNGQSFVVEMTLAGASDNGIHAPGTALSATINGFDKRDRRDLALGNLKGFLAAVFRREPTEKQKWGAIAKECCAKNLCAGKFVDVACEVKRLDSGFDFALLTWLQHDPDATQKLLEKAPKAKPPAPTAPVTEDDLFA